MPIPQLLALQADGAADRRPAALRDLEWLVTNGLGGFASGTVLGVPTRRYHGLFVPNLVEPKGRFVLIPRIDEQVDTGERLVALGGAEHRDERIDGIEPLHLREFRLDGSIPVWRYEIDGTVIEKAVVMPHGRNTVCLRYRLLAGPRCRIRVRIFAGPRRADSPLEPRGDRPFAMEAKGTHHELRIRGIAAALQLKTDGDSRFVVDPLIDHDVLFRVERDRGYDHSETMFSPGYYVLPLDERGSASLLASTEGWEALERAPSSLFDDERARAERLLDATGIEADDEVARRLVLAADQFIVLPGSRRDEAVAALASGEQLRSVMAGYHWFNDWGRDTMISLEGLTLCTRRHQEARAILRTFAHYIRDGLLPNLFPEGGREALYHTVDATLWYFHALDRYLDGCRDIDLLRDLYPVLQSVVDHHLEGTRFGIGVDANDGLISAAAEGYQLTWMDAKVADWVVTPRRGKPVEIQALWYNALLLMADWSEALGSPAPRYRELAGRVCRSFNARYWSTELGHLYDVVDGPDGDDARLRPNQVFALSLRHPVLDRRHWEPVLRSIEDRLLTPVGLRTLCPRDPDYQPFYQGSLRARDAAYHQGTVWPWLLGHFVDASIRLHGEPESARRLLRAFPDHLLQAGIGSISEVFDAEPPHAARGCIAQAWSVAEVLRAWLATRPRSNGVT